MSSLANNVISTFIQILTLFLFIKILLRGKIKDTSLKNITSFIGMSAVSLIIYNKEYNVINTLIFFFIIVLFLILVYKLNLSLSLIITGLFMITLFIGDTFASVIFINAFSIEQIRELVFICSNLIVCIITIGIISVNSIREKYINIIKLSSEKSNIDIIVFIALLILALCIIMYEITQSYFFGSNYILSVLGITIFIVLFIIYFIEKYDKKKIIDKYDQLFEYVKTFEDWIDNEKISIHESKNQLVTLRDMVKRNKKAKEYIDNIIKDSINIESKNFEKLKYVPKGGLKGLLFYKIAKAENEKIEMFIDVSKNVKSTLEKLDTEENKILCRLVGIFFDNAIEASRLAPKKIISCEIYNNSDYLIVAISNTFYGNIELNKIYQNGYSTKGENRGKGLYLAKKEIIKKEIFFLDTRIINKYYVQKIKIKKY